MPHSQSTQGSAQTRPLTRSTAYLRFMRALLATNLKASVAKRGQFWLQVGFMIINNVIWFTFWWSLMDHVQELRGWGLRDVMLLFGIAACGFGAMQAFAGGVRHLSRLIDNGELDPLLVQPKATWLYAVGARSQPSGFGDMVSGSYFLYLSGYVRWDNALLACLCIASSACVFLAVGLVTYSLAFWLPRTESLSRQAQDFVLLFSSYPESLFTGVMRILLFTVLPAGFITYVPVHVLRDASLSEVPLAIAAAGAFLTTGIWIFGRGLRRYASGSRFSLWT